MYNFRKFLDNLEREYGRPARKEVGKYLARGYKPDKALELAGVK